MTAGASGASYDVAGSPASRRDLPGALWIIVLASLAAGIATVVLVVFAGAAQRAREHQQDQQRLDQLERGTQVINGVLDSMRSNQDCMIALLLITPEQRQQLTDVDVATICPPVPKLEDLIAPTTTTTTAAPSSSHPTTSTTRKPTTSTTRPPSSAPPPTTSTTTTTAPPTTTTSRPSPVCSILGAAC